MAGALVQFLRPAPGHLTLEGSTYYMDWRVGMSHYGMTVPEAEAFIGGILGDSSGWEQAGIVARQTVDAPVVFRDSSQRQTVNHPSTLEPSGIKPRYWFN